MSEDKKEGVASDTTTTEEETYIWIAGFERYGVPYYWHGCYHISAVFDTEAAALEWANSQPDIPSDPIVERFPLNRDIGMERGTSVICPDCDDDTWNEGPCLIHQE